jgi:putative endonuclease
VYILKYANGRHYTGLTGGEEPEQRLSEHQVRLSPNAFTATRLSDQLVNQEYFDLVVDAIAAERKIKGWSRATKEALIKGDWKVVHALSKTVRRKGQRFILKDPSRLAALAPQGEDLRQLNHDTPFEARFASTSG